MFDIKDSVESIDNNGRIVANPAMVTVTADDLYEFAVWGCGEEHRAEIEKMDGRELMTMFVESGADYVLGAVQDRLSSRQ